MKKFCKSLKAAREAAGFPSAYKFYHNNGGKKHFPFTFVHYTRIENGTSLPKPESIEHIFLALRILPTEASAKELLTAYLNDMMGGGRVGEYILGPLFSKNEATSGDNLKWMKRYNSEHLTPEVFTIMTSCLETYWCSEALFNSVHALSSEAWAKKLDLNPAKVKTALGKLSKCSIAVKTKDGKYKCAKPGKVFYYPGRLEGMGPCLDKIKTYWQDSNKYDLFERFWIGKTTNSDMLNYRFTLSQAIDQANNYVNHSEETPGNFFLIETKIRKLKDF